MATPALGNPTAENPRPDSGVAQTRRTPPPHAAAIPSVASRLARVSYMGSTRAKARCEHKPNGPLFHRCVAPFCSGIDRPSGGQSARRVARTIIAAPPSPVRPTENRPSRGRQRDNGSAGRAGLHEGAPSYGCGAVVGVSAGHRLLGRATGQCDRRRFRWRGIGGRFSER